MTSFAVYKSESCNFRQRQLVVLHQSADSAVVPIPGAPFIKFPDVGRVLPIITRPKSLIIL
ncbi:hypothetical protein J6590_040421 [Homalodisca vitripennis]|nr:hypothetical protein J6590_040421 [Homalodisca vitripennis]